MPVSLTFDMPCPSWSILGPNGRPHWGEKAREKAKAKANSHIAALAEANRRRDLPLPLGECRVHYEWIGGNPKDRDNIIGTCKPVVDGLCPWLIANDKTVRFDADWRKRGRKEKQTLRVTVTAD